METGTVVAGATININRSDGRVHPAVVVAVNQEGNFVRVEWFESGETKGKDVDFRVASMLNPSLKFDNNSIIETSSPKPSKKIEEDSIINNKFPSKKGIPVNNNRRTNVGRRRLPSSSIIGETTAPSEMIYPKVNSATTRSQFSNINKDHQNSIIQEIGKLEKNRNEKRLKHNVSSSIKSSEVSNGGKKVNNQNRNLAAMVAEYRARLTFNPIMMDDLVEDHLITVCVRKRPMNKSELSRNEVDILSVPRKNTLIVHEPKTKVDLTKYIENHNFKFDYAFDEKCDNKIVYKYTAQPLVKTIFEGGFATCFAYGQTGSGKTYTMTGDVYGNDVGIYGLAITDVFKTISSTKFRHLNLSVSCSFFEIYSGKVLDLLNGKANLKILEDGKQQVQVVGLKEKFVINTEEVLTLINKGNILRTSGQTSANSNSSRSHAVFQIYLRKNGVVHGKLSLIDLAGNERGADTFSADRQTRLEGGEINKSLLALKECIRALGRKGAHLPFRVSKLTQVLRDSFIGNNARTCMIAMLSPSVCSCENTLNTLRYADRVKELGSGETTNESTVTSAKSDYQNGDRDEDEDKNRRADEFQRAESRLFDNHKSMLGKLSMAEKEGHSLLKMTNGYEFDKKSYVHKLENLVDDAISNLLVTKDYIDEFKAKLSSRY